MYGHQPDWVIMGMRNTPTGVTVMASRSLRHIQMQYEMWSSYEAPRIEMGLEMYDLIVIEAPTYGEALRRLFEQFDPETSNQRGLPAAVTSIDTQKAIKGDWP